MNNNDVIKEIKHMHKGAWLRIFILTLLIIAVYIWGLFEGMNIADEDNFNKFMANSQSHREELNRGFMRNSFWSGSRMNHSSMNMDQMVDMLKGKTGDELDKAFLEAMIPHHQGAIDMAKYLTNAKHDELKKLGAEIIGAQANEIAQMEKWMKDWGYTSTGATATGVMMDHSMMMHN